MIPDFSILPDSALNEFDKIWEKIDGRKHLILDSDVNNLLKNIIDINNISLISLINLFDSDKIIDHTIVYNIVYMCKLKMSNMKFIIRHIRKFVESHKNVHFHLFFIPKGSMACIKILEENGIFTPSRYDIEKKLGKLEDEDIDNICGGNDFW